MLSTQDVTKEKKKTEKNSILQFTRTFAPRFVRVLLKIKIKISR